MFLKKPDSSILKGNREKWILEGNQRFIPLKCGNVGGDREWEFSRTDERQGPKNQSRSMSQARSEGKTSHWADVAVY